MKKRIIQSCAILVLVLTAMQTAASRPGDTGY